MNVLITQQQTKTNASIFRVPSPITMEQILSFVYLCVNVVHTRNKKHTKYINECVLLRLFYNNLFIHRRCFSFDVAASFFVRFQFNVMVFKTYKYRLSVIDFVVLITFMFYSHSGILCWLHRIYLFLN